MIDNSAFRPPAVKFVNNFLSCSLSLIFFNNMMRGVTKTFSVFVETLCGVFHGGGG